MYLSNCILKINIHLITDFKILILIVAILAKEQRFILVLSDQAFHPNEMNYELFRYQMFKY